MYLLTIVLFYLLALAHAVPIVKRIVITPHILTPTANTTWNVGSIETVMWDTSEVPSGNFTGQLLLGNQTSNSENLDLNHPLAAGFPLSKGSISITVPYVQSGTHYIVILFGDSGNKSPPFTITGGGGGSISSPSSSPSAADVAIPSPPITVLPTSSSLLLPFYPFPHPTSTTTLTPSLTPTATTTPNNSSPIATSPSSSAPSSSTSTPATSSSSTSVATSSTSGSPSASNGALPVAHAHNAGALSLCAAAAVLSLVMVL